MNKATSWEDKYSEIEKAYRYAEEVGTFVGNLCLGLQCRSGKGREFVEIQDIVNEIKSREEELSRITDFEILNRIFPSEEYNPGRVLIACRSLKSLIAELIKLSANEIRSYPIEGLDIEIFDEYKTWFTYKGLSYREKEHFVVSLYYKVVRLLDKANLDRQHVDELEIVYRSLPGILAYQNSSTANKPKKSRSLEAIRKEKDFLYLLDRYEAWQAKKTEETRRRRFNPEKWLEDFDSWTQKSKDLFAKYAESEDDNSEIIKIIRYAQKIKRERSKGGE
jgi:hypothetical protein